MFSRQRQSIASCSAKESLVTAFYTCVLPFFLHMYFNEGFQGAVAVCFDSFYEDEGVCSSL